MKTKIAAIVGSALVLTTFGASPVLAQNTNQQLERGQTPAERVMPGRIGGDREDRQNRRQRNQRPAPPADPAVIMAEAQAVVAAASVDCTVTQANLLGQDAETNKIFEAVCATGPGYILVGSTPPQAVDCVQLAYQADITRRNDPAADVGPQCAIEQNQDVMRVLRAYAVEAGVDCTVDEAALRGKASSGALVYEIGCSARDGYWIEKGANGWTKTECIQIISQNGTCQFSTPEEQASTLKTRFAGSDAATCDVAQARYMGSNANGTFYEARCNGADGVIVRFNTEFAVQQIYPCAEAGQVGGGCKLTTAAPVAAPEA